MKPVFILLTTHESSEKDLLISVNELRHARWFQDNATTTILVNEAIFTVLERPAKINSLILEATQDS